MSKYTPAGYSICPVSTVGGKPVCSSRALEHLITLLPQAKVEYGDSCTIRSSVSENGHTNRDGDYSCSYSTSFEIVAEQPYYSHEDNLLMMRERLEAMIRTGADKHGILLKGKQ